MLDEELFDAEEKMEKAVDTAKNDLASLRTGRANPNMFSRIQIDYYGAPTPLLQMATITVQEARMAVIKPYDMSQLQNVEKAIRDSDLGVNPSNDGNVLRVVFPQLTEERRRELAKVVNRLAEDGRVAVRNVRRDAISQLKQLVDNGDVGADEEHRGEERVQKLTDEHIHRIDELLKKKDSEIMEV